ncbi:MAG: TonB-dependent receptor [Pseudomonadota bacterium]
MILTMFTRYRWVAVLMFLLCTVPVITVQGLAAEQPASGEQTQKDTESVDLGDVTVQAERLRDNIDITPGAITINLEDYKKAGTTHTVLDILKDRAIIDFRGAGDLTPTNDDIQMRGFDTRQFTTAVDGLPIQKLGGTWGGHFVDYSLIPIEQIESIEILPGPHSALYEGKSFGGVINIKTKTPVRRETPEVKFQTTDSYASLGTYDTSLTASGGGGSMDYVVGVKQYHTDGYLKNNDYDLTSLSARMAWLLPHNGYFSVLGTTSDKSEGIACENDPNGNFYDAGYPVVERGDVSGRWRDPDLNAKRDKNPQSIRLNWQQPSDLGRWNVGYYYAYENQRYDTDAGLQSSSEWMSQGANIQNEFYLTDSHLITIGTDGAKLGRTKADQDIVRTFSGFIQDRWRITPQLTFTPGVRVERVRILWSNLRGSGYANPDIPLDYIEKNYDDIMPKAFVSYDMSGLAGFLRDTSVSMGLSRIWTPRANCEVCTWGSGVEADPTKGYGMDLIFQRRLWKEITLMIDFSHYEFDNYVIMANSSTDYYQNSPWTRRTVGLEDVSKNGVEMELNGNITDKLSMNIGFGYVDWQYDGPDSGIEGMSAGTLGNRAKYRINSGLTYNFTERLQFHMDYKHQDKQERDVVDIIDEDTGEYEVRTVKIDSYGIMDVSLSYCFLEKWYRVEKPTIKLFANNALDKDYVNVSGYPATERTYGVSVSSIF